MWAKIKQLFVTDYNRSISHTTIDSGVDDLIDQIPNLQGNSPITVATRNAFKLGYEMGFKHGRIKR
jgi:hypothetical protein